MVIVRDAERMEWVPSPVAGVWRKRLEHTGPPESGRVTSIVRYDPGSTFTEHAHPEGEEILVLDGVFSDETGDHPAGTYLLNPDGSRHSPRTGPGCLLFVKLRQYPGSDRPTVRVDTRSTPLAPHPDQDGVEVLELYAQPGHPERVELLRLAPGTAMAPTLLPGGAEILVLEGTITDAHGTHGRLTWLRLPPGTANAARTEPGCLLYVKRGHLA